MTMSQRRARGRTSSPTGEDEEIKPISLLNEDENVSEVKSISSKRRFLLSLRHHLPFSLLSSKNNIIVLLVIFIIISYVIIYKTVDSDENMYSHRKEVSKYRSRIISQMDQQRPKPHSIEFYNIHRNPHANKSGIIHKLQKILTSHRTSKLKNVEPDDPYKIHMTNKDYKNGRREPFIHGDCVQSHTWQLEHHLNCNILHEFPLYQHFGDHAEVVSEGFWRLVWRVSESFDSNNIVLKTLRWDHKFTDRNLDRHRREALATERVSSSKYTLDIFGFCGASSMFEYSDGGSIDNFLFQKKKPSMQERLKVATQAALGLSDTHDIEGDGFASIAHTDIVTSQFLFIDGVYKLNDFNRCRFMRWNKRLNEPCGYTVPNNPGPFRSPEEYEYDVQNEKVDVYSLGNVFYVLLTENYPFQREKERVAKQKVKAGERPEIPVEILEKTATDPAAKAILEAIQMCWTHKTDDRPSARTVANFLVSAMKRLAIYDDV